MSEWTRSRRMAHGSGHGTGDGYIAAGLGGIRSGGNVVGPPRETSAIHDDSQAERGSVPALPRRERAAAPVSRPAGGGPADGRVQNRTGGAAVAVPLPGVRPVFHATF